MHRKYCEARHVCYSDRGSRRNHAAQRFLRIFLARRRRSFIIGPILAPVNIFLHGAGLLSTFFLNSVALDLASLAANYRGGRDYRAFVEPYVAGIFRSDDNSS